MTPLSADIVMPENLKMVALEAPRSNAQAPSLHTPRKEDQPTPAPKRSKEVAQIQSTSGSEPSLQSLSDEEFGTRYNEVVRENMRRRRAKDKARRSSVAAPDPSEPARS